MTGTSRHSAKGKALKLLPFVFILALAGVLVACGSSGSSSSTSSTQTSWRYSSPITADSATGFVTEDQWAQYYPNEASTFDENSDWSAKTSYIDEYPFLSIIYEGTPFSTDYDTPRGHTYTLDDVQATTRVSEKTKATCYACKGPSYTLLEKQMGAALYTTPFADVTPSMTSAITCYDCHLNNPAQVVSSRAFFNKAFPNASIDWGSSAAACGQCHNEYYFDATTKAVAVPPDMTDPTEVSDYYNSIGFVDYTNPSTGVKQIKAQHPEVQMFAGSAMQEAGLSCVDCHMERSVDDSGNAYTNHKIVSPASSTQIQTEVCGRCHSDVDAQMSEVVDIMETTKARETEVGNELATLTTKLTEASQSGAYTDDELNQVRSLARDAQWYWDFEFVENSSGFHNPDKATMCLDKSEELCNQAIALLNK